MFTINVQGIEEAKGLLKTLENLGNAIKSVDLNAKARQDGSDKNNAQILGYLADGGRDFVTPSDSELAEIEKTLVQYLEEGLQNIANIKAKTEANAAKQIAAKAFLEAAKVWQEQISNHIANGKWIGDGGELSPEYAKQKEEKFGFTKPIGVATGQVRDNVAPANRNLKLRS